MSTFEKALIYSILLFGIGFKIFGLLNFRNFYLATPLAILSLLILLIYYLVRTKLSVWTIVFISIIIHTIGAVFKILHWMGAAELQLVGVTGSIIFSIAILWTFKFTAERFDTLYYYVALLIFLQALLLVISVFGKPMDVYANFLTYPIVGIIGTIKLNNLQEKFGVDKLLNVFLIQGVLIVFHDLFSRF
jgi:hypothetical protein